MIWKWMAGAMGAAVLATAASAGATTYVYSGTVTNPPGTLQLTVPALAPGMRTDFVFTYSGGIPDGGEVRWSSESSFYEIYHGQPLSRDRFDETSCSFTFGDAYQAECFIGYPYTGFDAFSYQFTPGRLTASFTPGRNYDTCALGLEGGCAAYTDFSGGQLTAFFVGETDYVITVTMTAVPEPETWLILIFGFLGVGTILRWSSYEFALAVR